MAYNDGKTTDQRAPFKAEYPKKNQLGCTLLDPCAYHRKQVGSPSSGGSTTGKALNVQVHGSAYFPYDCGWCGIKGHKVLHCQDKKAGKPKKTCKKQVKDGYKRKGPKNGGLCFNCGKGNHFARDCMEPRKDWMEQPHAVTLTVKTAPGAQASFSRANEFRGYRLCQNYCSLGALKSPSFSYIPEPVIHARLTPETEAHPCELNCSWSSPSSKPEIVPAFSMDQSSIVIDPSVTNTNATKVFTTGQQLYETHTEDGSGNLAKTNELGTVGNAATNETIASGIESTGTASSEVSGGKTDGLSSSMPHANEQHGESIAAKHALELESQDERARKRFKREEGNQFSFIGSLLACVFGKLRDTAEKSVHYWNVERTKTE